MNKTPATVLQEMMVKRGCMPEYECVTQSGPHHAALFEYRCFALGNTVRAAARSKKEAKQDAARAMLACLAAQGVSVPPQYHRAPTPPDLESGPAVGGAALGTRSHVVLLRDLCEEYKLPSPEYTLVGDTGPPHCRQFTMRVAVARTERRATASTKKMARQVAAEQLYLYLRENLARLTKDYVEEDALARAHEKMMERYVELRDESAWRPDLGQKIADYHLGLLTHIDGDKRNAAMKALEDGSGDAAAPESLVEAAATALGLTAAWGALSAAGGALALLELAPASPALAFAACDRPRAAAAALRYLRRALTTRLPPDADPAPSAAAAPAK